MLMWICVGNEKKKKASINVYFGRESQLRVVSEKNRRTVADQGESSLEKHPKTVGSPLNSRDRPKFRRDIAQIGCLFPSSFMLDSAFCRQKHQRSEISSMEMTNSRKRQRNWSCLDKKRVKSVPSLG